jgi:hypothetical protein
MTSIKRLFGISAILSAASSAVLFAGDAHATITCTFGTLAACSGTEGALTFSGFVATATGGTSFESNDTISISYDSIMGEYVILSTFTPGVSLSGTGDLDFNISAATGYTFLSAAANMDSSGTNSIAYNIPNMIGTLVTNGGPVTDNFLPGQSTTSVSAQFNAQSIRSSSLTLKTTPLFYNQVPGSLPILGAGAAFGYSRKLRRRTNQSKAA